MKSKSDEICRLIPGIKNEIDWGRGKSKTSKEDYSLIFKNGSVLDVMAGTSRSRGLRATGGCMEEVILIDQTILNEVIIPTERWGLIM